MIHSRRYFIKTLTAGTIGSTLININSLNLFAKSSFDKKKGIKIDENYYVLDDEKQRVLIGVAEIFYPRAGEINMINGFINYFSKPEKKKEAEFFDGGLWNLNSVSYSNFQKPFYKLNSVKKKLKILNHIYARNKIFIEKFNNLATQIYFSSPIIWKELGYEGPPQPRGFLNYTEPPSV